MVRGASHQRHQSTGTLMGERYLLEKWKDSKKYPLLLYLASVLVPQFGFLFLQRDLFPARALGRSGADTDALLRR